MKTSNSVPRSALVLTTSISLRNPEALQRELKSRKEMVGVSFFYSLFILTPIGSLIMTASKLGTTRRSAKEDEQIQHHEVPSTYRGQVPFNR